MAIRHKSPQRHHSVGQHRHHRQPTAVERLQSSELEQRELELGQLEQRQLEFGELEQRQLELSQLEQRLLGPVAAASMPHDCHRLG
jgi:hypothetical protein